MSVLPDLARQDLSALSPRERYRILCELLPTVTLEELLEYRKTVCALVPQLRPSLGFDQRSPHHRYDLYTHVAHVVSLVPGDLTLRWAALLHDIGKPIAFTLDENSRGHFKGHAMIGSQMADRILTEMEAPRPLRERVVFLISLHMARLIPDEPLLRNYVNRFGLDVTTQLLALQKADMRSKGVPGEERQEQFAEVERLLAALTEEKLEGASHGPRI